MITRLPLRVVSPYTLRWALSCPFQQWPSLRNARLYSGRELHYLILCQRRQYSTPSSSTDAPRPIDLRSQFSAPEVPQPLLQPAPKRSLRRYIYAAAFLLLGLTAGQYARLVIVPPPLPLPNSPEDRLMIEFLTKRAEQLPIVLSLSSDPNWISYDAYSIIPPEARSQGLTTGTLSGARALGGFQRIFCNDESGECISVIWFGGAIAGWPGVTHGGAIATILDESLGRCAIRTLPSKTAMTANLQLNYLKPTITNSFYVIRATAQWEGATDHKKWITGRLETLDGKVCVEAKGLFVVPKTAKTRSLAGNF